MKLARKLLAVMGIIAFIFSCQKELSFDPNGPSQGTLKEDAGNNCLPSTVNGLYQKDSVLNTTHYMDVQVNVAIIGVYEIKSDTVNGFSFKASGKFGIKGLNTIRLYGSGKPLAAGITFFTITYNNTSCTISVNVTGPGTGTAVFTLAGAPGTCSGALVNGIYQAGVALNATNTVDLQVNVTTPGTYNIAAASVNGMLFTGSGLFSTTGINVVTLTGAGTPLLAGVFNATATNGTNSCTYSITVIPAAGGSALFTLNGAPGACAGATVNGTYTAGTALTASNTVTVQVTVATIGTYNITTNTDNGISFSGTGTFTTLGVQAVTLTGTGTPAAAGTNNFTATAGVSSCTFSVTTTPGGGGTGAFTLDGSPGACTGAIVAGTYTAGTALAAANTVTLNINVTAIGNYSITTNTVNGYSFNKTGTFTATGPQTVVLTGTGTPVAAGNNNFTATNGATSTCTFTVTVNAAGTAGAFTLDGAPGACTGALVAGTYTTGFALTAANTVTLNINVTTIGTYTISTNTVNGYSFSKSGTFTVIGAQTVVLNGTGTPIAAGSNNFTATNGATSTCTFTVTVVAAPANNDYIPLTANSWWSYNSDGYTPDTMYKKATVLRTIAGNSYREIDMGDGLTVDDSLHFRKAGNDYFEYTTLDSFASHYFSDYQFGELLILKENAAAGTAWQSAIFTGTDNSTGQPLRLQYFYDIGSINGTLTVNGVTYNNVTKVNLLVKYDLNNAGFLNDTRCEFYYSRGIGLIKFNFRLDANPPWDYVDDIRFYQVF